MTVNVSGTAGPFVITSQNTDNLSWFQGQSNTINWSVNNTQYIARFCYVNIRLSVDGGATFPMLLASNK
jgi:hypothetical protein